MVFLLIRFGHLENLETPWQRHLKTLKTLWMNLEHEKILADSTPFLHSLGQQVAWASTPRRWSQGGLELGSRAKNDTGSISNFVWGPYYISGLHMDYIYIIICVYGLHMDYIRLDFTLQWYAGPSARQGDFVRAIRRPETKGRTQRAADGSHWADRLV